MLAAMAVKMTVQGMLIYIAMAAHLLAFVVSAAGHKRAGWVGYTGGFVLACVALAFRWWQAGHVPLQNMFEVFLVLAALMFPLSVWCSKVWQVEGQQWDMLLVVLLLTPAGFAISEELKKLPPALQTPLFIPHVLAYMLAYVMMAKAAIEAIRQLAAGRSERAVTIEAGSYKIARLGLVLLTAGLVLGAWWGKLAWGRYWGWDTKEMWSLATWLVYLGYFHFRALYGRRYARINAAFLLVGLLAVLFTLVAVSYLMKSQHSYA